MITASCIITMYVIFRYTFFILNCNILHLTSSKNLKKACLTGKISANKYNTSYTVLQNGLGSHSVPFYISPVFNSNLLLNDYASILKLSI